MGVDAPTYSVADFADEILGSDPGINLVGAGPAAAEVAQWTDAETLASPLIATVLWHAFLAGGGLEDFIRTYRELFPRGKKAVRDVFVLRHPLRAAEPRYDLMLLVNDEVESRGINVKLPEERIVGGWEKLRRDIKDEAKAGAAVGVFADSPDALIEASQAQRYGVLIAPAPEMIRSSYPSPAVDVRSDRDDEDFSSAGLLVKRVDDGVVGVTIALHAVEEAGRDKVGAAVSVGGRDGTVRSLDAITDSCFVELAEVDGIPIGEVNGVLRGLAPRIHMQAFFEGSGSGRQRTYITGSSPEIPLVTRRMQLRVVTEPDTVPGDSGAALVGEDGFVLGFAFERTGYNERPPFASWIWADSVMRAHNLRLIEEG